MNRTKSYNAILFGALRRRAFRRATPAGYLSPGPSGPLGFRAIRARRPFGLAGPLVADRSTRYFPLFVILNLVQDPLGGPAQVNQIKREAHS